MQDAVLTMNPLRRAPHAARPAAKTIAVASGKGGVGKTWFAVTLAHALARRGERVLLFDADLGLANIDIQLGVQPIHDLGGVVEGRVTLEQACLSFVPGGFDIMAGRSGSGTLAALDAASLGRVLDALGNAASRYDHVLLDLGAGLDRVVRRMACWADLLLVLATEEPTSMTDAYATLKLHAADRPDAAASIVINQAPTAAAGQRTYATLAHACQEFLGKTPPLAGIIRRDAKVVDAIRRQTLLLVRHPTSAAGEDVERVAAALA